MKATIIAALLLASTFAFAKDYQVTGTVLDVKGDTIIVDKKGEKFEIVMPATTKKKGEVKKGDKVTVYYSMSATEIEVKPEAKAKK